MSRRRLRPLAPRTADLYGSLMKRAFGDASPSFAPDVSDMPESVRVPLRAAVIRHWAEKGDRARGEKIADDIPEQRRAKRKKVRPSADEESAFEKQLKKEPPRTRALIQVGLGLGLRAEELLQMPRSVFEGAAKWGKLTVTGKGFKERVLDVRGVKGALQEMLALTANQPHALEERGDDREWKVPGHIIAAVGSVFHTQHNMLRRRIKQVAAAAGLNPDVWTPHTLRHVFAQRMLRDGAPLNVIQAALGHENIATTIKYLGVTPEDIAKFMRGVRR